MLFRSSFGFWGFIGVVLFAVGLSKVLSWRQVAGVATHSVLQAVPVQPPVPAPTPNTAQLNQQPRPVFSALPPGTRTDELEPARLTNNGTSRLANRTPSVTPSVTEDETLRLQEQRARQHSNWKME